MSVLAVVLGRHIYTSRHSRLSSMLKADIMLEDLDIELLQFWSCPQGCLQEKCSSIIGGRAVIGRGRMLEYEAEAEE